MDQDATWRGSASRHYNNNNNNRIYIVPLRLRLPRRVRGSLGLIKTVSSALHYLLSFGGRKHPLIAAAGFITD